MAVHLNNNCEICHQHFHHKNSLKAHMRTHLADPYLYQDKYKCMDCLITFSSASVARRHRNLKHTVKFVCRKCNRYFSHRWQHSLVHKAPTLKCIIGGCSKTFHLKTNRKAHLERFHKLIFKVKCPQCDTIFSSKYLFDSHLLQKHEERNLSDLKFEGSNSQTTKKDKLPRDLRSRTGYQNFQSRINRKLKGSIESKSRKKKKDVLKKVFQNKRRIKVTRLSHK